MSHQVLARKWRPRRFNEVIGQPHVVQALTNALNQQYLHHAYLLTGTRGVGKTTIARIIAKCLNCEKGISANPCGECNHCQEIDNGRFPDLYEVDAASRTKVEDTRELLDNVQYAPTKGRYKVYIIDEVHMLSGHSFNALLKTLEEPPEHVKFILATTDPQRLPATILSRCLQFHLLQITPQQIADHLQTILSKENVEYDVPATLLLGKAANGSMRDALSLLDQAIAFGNGKIATDDVKAMLGTIENTVLFEVLQALSQHDANTLIQCAIKLTEQGADFSHALMDLLSLLHQIAVMQVVPNATVDDASPQLTELAKKISREDVQLYYQIGLIGQRDLPLAPTPRSGFEMILLRMLAFTPMQSANLKTQTFTVSQSTTSNQQSVVTTQPATHKPQSVSQTIAWDELLPQLNLTGMAQQLAQQCSLKEITEDQLHLILDPKQKPLLQEKNIQRINQALTTYFGKNMTANIDIGESDIATPATLAKQHKEQQQQTAQEAIFNDTQVQRIMQKFDATVIKESITPLEH